MKLQLTIGLGLVLSPIEAFAYASGGWQAVGVTTGIISIVLGICVLSSITD